MDPEKQENQPMITCVMVNDPTKKTTQPTKLTNYHVNRIQVNCYTSSETNDLITNSSPNITSSPTSSDSSSSSKLFFVDKKTNSNQFISKSTCLKSASTSLQKNVKKDLLRKDLQKELQRFTQKINDQSNNVQNFTNNNSLNESLNKANVDDLLRVDGLTMKVNNLTSIPTAKSIYSEQSLKKQIQQFKERQLQNQLHYYSSTSSTASSTSSSQQQFINNKNLIDKHLSDKHKNDKLKTDRLNKNDRNVIDRQMSDKNLSESEPLGSFNYSVNSNCSTTDTLVTNSTIRSTGNDEISNNLTVQYETQYDTQYSPIELSDDEITNQTLLTNASSNSTTNSSKIISNANPKRTSNIASKVKNNSSLPNKTESTDHSNEIRFDRNKETVTTDQPISANQNDSNKTNLNELYLFSIKRPTELKHYTHQIKFMKTPGCSFLTSFLIFTAILVISILFTIGICISVQVLNGQPLTERKFEGQMLSLGISQFWNSTNLNNFENLNVHNNLNNNFNLSMRSTNNLLIVQKLNQLIMDDLRIKFEQVFNQSDQLSNRFKSVKILSIKKYDSNVNRTDHSVHSLDDKSIDNLGELNYLKNSSQLNRSEHHFHDTSSNLLTKLSLSSTNEFSSTNQSSSDSSFDLDNLLNDFLKNKILIEFKILFNSNELDLDLSASSVYLAISNELIKLNESLFNHYNLDQSSLNIKEIYPEDQLDKTIQNLLRLVLNNSTSILNNRRLKRLQLIKLNQLNKTSINQIENLDELDYLSIDSNQTESINKNKRRCEEKKLKFCSFLPFNNIEYPNLVNHHSLEELENEFIYFRQIIDSECFYLAKEFICLLIQPACSSIDSTVHPTENSIRHSNYLPCGQLCDHFLQSCSGIINFLPVQIRNNLVNSCRQLNNKLEDKILLSTTNTQLSSSLKNETIITSAQPNDSIEKQANSKTKNEDENTMESRNNLIIRTNKRMNSTKMTNDALNNETNLNSEIISNWKNDDHYLSSSVNNKNLANSIIKSSVTKAAIEPSIKSTSSPISDPSNDYLTVKNDSISWKRSRRELKQNKLDFETSIHSDKYRIVYRDDALSDAYVNSNNSKDILEDAHKEVYLKSSKHVHKENSLTNNSTSKSNNQQLVNYCFNLEDLEQLSSVRTLN